ncbi:MAG: hypothetical protein WAK18_17910 [Nocardioidaceae bacterium]
MPVVTLQCLPPPDADSDAVERALRGIVSAVASALRSDPGSTWAHWVPMADVFQGLERMGFRGHCPVVTIRGRARDDDSVAAVLAGVAAAVSAALKLPLEDVWVQWLEVEPGRAFAGGQLVT